MGNDRKSRGAYYTPAPLAEAICRWAIRSRGDRVFDPSAGDGAFLRAAAPLVDAPTDGIELDAAAAREAGVRCGDFFEARHGTYDAVVGNPPFIRYQRFAGKERALERARAAGLSLNGEVSAWAPFVAVAATLVRPGGRLAMVIPREALFVNYTRPLLDFLARRFRVELAVIDALLFDALEKVAVLLCEPGRGLTIREVADLRDLGGGESFEGRPWVWSRVPRDCRGAVDDALAAGRPLSEVARLRLGIVTGDKEFFVMTPDAAGARGLRDVTPVYASPSELGGPPSRVLLTASALDAPLRRYVRDGERRGVHRRYKCQIRTPWWSIAPGPRPDAFLGYLVSRRPAFRLNTHEAVSTNNVHQVFFNDGPVALDHPLTHLSVELIGRIYGGGVLKIEPGDAGRIVVPRGRVPQVRRIVRAVEALRARRLSA